MNKFDLDKKLAMVEKIKKSLPIQLGNMIRTNSLQAWQKQGWTNTGFVKWEPRKSKKNDKGRAILVKTGKLRNSIKVTRATWAKVIVGSSRKYAKAHNVGVGKMPKRQFLGDSVILERKLRVTIVSAINKVLL